MFSALSCPGCWHLQHSSSLPGLCLILILRLGPATWESWRSYGSMVRGRQQGCPARSSLGPSQWHGFWETLSRRLAVLGEASQHYGGISSVCFFGHISKALVNGVVQRDVDTAEWTVIPHVTCALRADSHLLPCTAWLD